MGAVRRCRRRFPMTLVQQDPGRDEIITLPGAVDDEQGPTTTKNSTIHSSRRPHWHPSGYAPCPPLPPCSITAMMPRWRLRTSIGRVCCI